MCDLVSSSLLFLVTSCFVVEITSHGSTHHHHVGGEKLKSLHDPKVAQDVEHIKEHYQGTAEFNESAMTPEELEFHYFKLHDFDNNTKLDGLEILTALTDLMPYSESGAKSQDGKNHANSKETELKYYTDIIDAVLKEDDIDNDGYLTYMEYVLAKKREEAHESLENARKRSENRR